MSFDDKLVDNLSVNQIIHKIIENDSSPICSWLTNVIETYLNHSQKMEPLTLNKLFELTNDMLMNYSISDSQLHTKQICTKLFTLLQSNKHIPEFVESFPINSKCIALYSNDNEWYNATVIEIEQPGYKYTIQFDGYNEQQSVIIDQIQSLNLDQTTADNNTNDSSHAKKSVTLKDNIKQEIVDVNLQTLLNENDDSSMGFKNKKKYVNTPIVAFEVGDDEFKNECRFNEKQFEMFENEQQPDDNNNNKDEEDLQKLMVGTGPNRRKINPKSDICCICNRKTALTWHHLIPRCTHSKMISNHGKNKDYLNKHGIWICRACHSAIHGMYENWILATKYYELKLLLESGSVQKWISYISKRKLTSHTNDSRVKGQRNRVSKILSDKKDHSTKIKYIK